MSNQDDKIETWESLAHEIAIKAKYYNGPSIASLLDAMPNNPVMESILNQDESAQRYSRLTSGIPRSPVIDALMKQDDKPKPKDYDIRIACRVGRTPKSAETLLLESNKEMYDLIYQHPDVIRKTPTNVTASQVNDAEMAGRLRQARGDYPSDWEIKAARFMQARISEQTSNLFMYGKPLTTMTQAEYDAIDKNGEEKSRRLLNDKTD